jgi:hypothetical protein
MTDERLTDELAVQGMGWRPGPDRYLKSGRSWIPRWRFQPLVSLADALELLDHTAQKYSLSGSQHGPFTARVQIGSCTGKVSGESKARTIALAVATALEINVEVNS